MLNKRNISNSYDKEIISNTYKECTKFSVGATNNPTLRWAEDLNIQFPKKNTYSKQVFKTSVQKTKYIKEYLSSLIMRNTSQNFYKILAQTVTNIKIYVYILFCNGYLFNCSNIVFRGILFVWFWFLGHIWQCIGLTPALCSGIYFLVVFQWPNMLQGIKLGLSTGSVMQAIYSLYHLHNLFRPSTLAF